MGEIGKTQNGVETEAVPTDEGALDPGAELVQKALGNQVFGEKRFLHEVISTVRRMRSQLWLRRQPRCAVSPVANLRYDERRSGKTRLTVEYAGEDPM